MFLRTAAEQKHAFALAWPSVVSCKFGPLPDPPQADGSDHSWLRFNCVWHGQTCLFVSMVQGFLASRQGAGADRRDSTWL